ncbi:MAG: hypothetical protein ACFFF4_01200 [Candidatus Thorarchaeota archaeon]
MQKHQVGIILGIGIICAASIPLLLPRASFVGTAFPNPIMLSAIIGLAGAIVLVLAIMAMFKS